VELAFVLLVPMLMQMVLNKFFLCGNCVFIFPFLLLFLLFPIHEFFLLLLPLFLFNFFFMY
jgi:hypothetical protein